MQTHPWRAALPCIHFLRSKELFLKDVLMRTCGCKIKARQGRCCSRGSEWELPPSSTVRRSWQRWPVAKGSVQPEREWKVTLGMQPSPKHCLDHWLLNIQGSLGQDQYSSSGKASSHLISQPWRTVWHKDLRVWNCWPHSLFAFRTDMGLQPATGMDWHIKEQTLLWYHQSNSQRPPLSHCFAYYDQQSWNLQLWGTAVFQSCRKALALTGQAVPRSALGSCSVLVTSQKWYKELKQVTVSVVCIGFPLNQWHQIVKLSGH